MRKLRLCLAAAALASAFTVLGVGPANAKCVGDPINPCVLICSLENKWTDDLLPCEYI
jgi:hypothetical protein